MIENSKNYFKSAVWFFLKILLSLVVFIILYLGTELVLSRLAVPAQESMDKKEITLHILTNGIHTDLVVPTKSEYKDWTKSVNHLINKSDTTQYDYLALGWGDKGFYLNTPSWAELKTSTAIKAIFGLSGSAIHATYYPTMELSESCKKIMITEKQYQQLIEFISASFRKGATGEPIQIETKVKKTDTDAFYEATGRYSIFNTCNSWANKGLKHAGLKACMWTAFQKGIFLKYP